MYVICLLVFFANLSFAQWIPLNSGTNRDLRAIDFATMQIGYVVGDSGMIIKTTNAGGTWTPLNSGTSRMLNGIHVFNSETVIACGNNGAITRTTNGGLTWTTVNSSTTIALNAISFFGDSIGICGGQNGTLMRSTDGGASWVIAEEGFLSTYYGIHMVTSSIGWACGVNSIFAPLVARTSDGGMTWNYLTFYIQKNEATLRDIFFKDVDEGIAVSFVWTGEGGISHTTNGGGSWTSKIIALGLLSVDFPSHLTGYAVGINGTILKTTDRGEEWTPQLSGTSVNLWSVSFLDSLNGYVAGDNGTLLKTTTGGVTSTRRYEDLPLQFFLFQNYPNPFNPSTTLRLEVPVSVNVSLKVYNLLGQEVATLVNELKQPGTYAVPFKASGLPSGVYFYKLTAGNFSETRKLVLTR